ncbi:MAG: mechanosensitive ion channel domain-containing protein [Balneolaceae bacterium]
MNTLETWLETLWTDAGIGEEWAIYLRLLSLLLILSILGTIVFFVTKRVILYYLERIIRRTSFRWDDLLVDNKAFNNLAHIVPAILVRLLAPTLFSDFDSILPLVLKLTDIYLIVVGMTIFFACLKVGEYAVGSHPAFKEKPITSYFQLIRILLYIVIVILVLSIILERSPFYFLSAFGALSAIVLLIFKDTILGLVASVQMSSYNMVRVGDWIEMPKFNADGDVIEINLNTVKVQNWDKTITTIPTHYFVTDSFKNWRGMVQSGGRRINRSIFLDAHSVKFVNPEFREELKKYHLIRDFVERRQSEIETWNAEHEVDTSILINGRRMTNLGVFRHYIEAYLKHHPKVNQEMTIMVRQLATNSRGIPMEIYCFTETTAWVDYEAIQSDIFDHLYATAAFFELDIFQEPSGADISRALSQRGSQT